MIVGLVDVEGVHEVGERRAHHLLEVLGVFEVGHIEMQLLDGGHVEGEGFVAEVAVLDGEDETAHVDAAAEVDASVASHGDQAPGGRVGAHHHRLAVGDDELLHSADEQFVVLQVHAGVGALGHRLERQGIVVGPFLLGEGAVEVHQLVLNLHEAGDFVVRHQSVM